TSLAETHTTGTHVDWNLHGHPIDLPTYPFDRHRYWLEDVPAGGGDLTGTELPHSDGYLFTGRLSLHSHPWLADHTVMGTTIVPGTALVEMAIRAGDHVDCDTVDEL